MQISEEEEVLLEMCLTSLGFISSRFQKNLPASAGTGSQPPPCTTVACSACGTELCSIGSGYDSRSPCIPFQTSPPTRVPPKQSYLSNEGKGPVPSPSKRWPVSLPGKSRESGTDIIG